VEDPTPASENKKSWQRQSSFWAALLAVGIAFIVAATYVLVQADQRADPSAVATGFILLAIGCLMAGLGGRFLRAGHRTLARPAGRRRRGLVTTEDYDHRRYDIFNNALDAVCLGMGQDAPLVIVVDLPSPNSFNPLFGGKRVVAVTPALLSFDLTQAEVEAVMAVAAAKQAYWERFDRTGLPGGGLDEITWGIDKKEMQKEVWRAGQPGQDALVTCTTILNEDTLAARTTGQPAALASAIRKVASLLEPFPVRMKVPFAGPAFLEDYGVSEELVFVVPPLPAGVWNKFRPAARDELIRLRLENLEAIGAGMRGPHEVIREARPLVDPKGWL